MCINALNRIKINIGKLNVSLPNWYTQKIKVCERIIVENFGRERERERERERKTLRERERERERNRDREI